MPLQGCTSSVALEPLGQRVWKIQTQGKKNPLDHFFVSVGTLLRHPSAANSAPLGQNPSQGAYGLLRHDITQAIL